MSKGCRTGEQIQTRNTDNFSFMEHWQKLVQR